jgi:hypothetical protein
MSDRRLLDHSTRPMNSMKVSESVVGAAGGEGEGADIMRTGATHSAPSVEALLEIAAIGLPPQSMGAVLFSGQ